jgi:hypothetical protein
MNPQATLANWRSAPYNRWAFHHVRELIPTADIPARARARRAMADRAAGEAPLKLSSQALPIDAARIALTLRFVSRLRRSLAS